PELAHREAVAIDHPGERHEDTDARVARGTQHADGAALAVAGVDDAALVAEGVEDGSEVFDLLRDGRVLEASLGVAVAGEGEAQCRDSRRGERFGEGDEERAVLVGRDAVAEDDDVAAVRGSGVEGVVEELALTVADGIDHCITSTVRMPSWRSISSKARLTSSSGMRCDTKPSRSNSPRSAISTSCGTWVRPFAPPKLPPCTRRPVIRKRGTISSFSPLPATPSTVQR